jgi:putative membrane protein
MQKLAMFLEILIFLSLGMALGVLTGLLPGLHPNTVFVLVLSLAVFFTGFPVICTLVFIVSLSVSNVFLDFIPSILFGAPDPDSCLSVLPGHQMLMDGRGYEAVFLSAIGGLGAILLTILTLPALLFSIPFIYSQIYPFIHILLILVVSWMVWTDSRRVWALLIFLFTGVFGTITLNTLSDSALFPALTGLFGFSGLIVSFYGKSQLPPQKKTSRLDSSLAKSTAMGWFAGMLAGLLPGIGSSQAGAVAGQTFRAKTKDFLAALGGINAANIIFTLVAFCTLGKTRSGAVAAIAQLTPSLSVNELVLLMFTALLTAFISVILVLKTAGLMISRIHSVSYRKMNLSIIISLAAMVFLFTGPLGLLISFSGALIGILAIKTGIRRSHMMGFLIFPTILYFSGLTAVFSHMLGV